MAGGITIECFNELDHLTTNSCSPLTLRWICSEAQQLFPETVFSLQSSFFAASSEMSDNLPQQYSRCTTAPVEARPYTINTIATISLFIPDKINRNASQQAVKRINGYFCYINCVQVVINPQNFFRWRRQITLIGLFEDIPSYHCDHALNKNQTFMKKILFLFLGCLPFVFTSCNNSTESSTASAPPASNSMAEKNLAASRIVTDAFKSGDASKIDSAVAADFVDHTDRGDMGRDSLKKMIAEIHKEFPDMKTDVIREVADDDYVFSLMHFTGTSNGQMGMPKGPYDMHAVQVVRFKDGKAVEHWEYMQPEEMMKMMPPPPPAGKK